MATSAYRQGNGIAFAPLVDALLITLCGWLAYYTRWDTWSVPPDYLSVLVLGIGLVLVIFPLTGAYRSWNGRLHWRYAGNALPGLFAVTVLLMIAGTLTKTSAEFSRLWMGYWFLYAVIALFLFRWVSASLFALFGGGQQRDVSILLVGDGPFAHSVAERARAATDANWTIVGVVSPDPDSRQLPLPGTEQLSLEAMEALLAEPSPGVDEVWIAMDSYALEQKQRVIGMLQGSCLTVRYVPDLSMLALLNHVPSEVAGMTVIDLNASPLDGPTSLIKTATDKLIALAALLLLAPLFALLALLIRLDSPGPVFFRQPRHGWDGKIILVLKFRTMFHAASAQQYPELQQAQRDDPRVTRVGKLLRRSSLDELPQFFNVLRGDMSVVGPRPHPLALNKNYERRIDAYMQRHRVKPGITGWAQVHGLRGETETLEKMQMRVSYDLYYIENWSLWLDVKIILLTLTRGWTGKNAY
ncbi:MAG: undecaprenyl-phosphate glucose phosphotransferase [Halioglobus sp.]